MTQALYESVPLLNQYLHFHYGPEYFHVTNYAVACAEICLESLETATELRALELGCATGRTAFELARKGAQVTAIDLSRNFIACAQALQRGESVGYWLCEQGQIGEELSVGLGEFNLDRTADRVRFLQADAIEWLEENEHESYDLIFAGNLIDRLYEPARLLKVLPRLLRPHGRLVLSSPYTLLTEFTPYENWIGGFYCPPPVEMPVTVLDGLRQHLGPALCLAATPRNLPFVIRETARKYQYTLAEVTVWKHASD